MAYVPETAARNMESICSFCAVFHGPNQTVGRGCQIICPDGTRSRTMFLMEKVDIASGVHRTCRDHITVGHSLCADNMASGVMLLALSERPTVIAG